MRELIFVATVVMSSPAYGQANLQDILDAYKDSLTNYGIVALVDNGVEIQSAEIGWAQENHSMQISNRFCIGSVTKLYTAVVILKLQELNFLSIEDTIGLYIPNHKFIDGKIRIKHLLNHTSGIKDVVTAELINNAIENPFFDFSDTYILNQIDTLDFIKGTKYSYSNSNYFLLRKIIEIVSDKPYEVVLDELIIRPLNLLNTYPCHSNKIELLAHPIIGSQDLHNIPKTGVNKISIGIGNIVSDARDVNSFLRGVFIDKKVINSASLAQMTTFQQFGNTKIGLGVFNENLGGKEVYGHTGRTLSYITYALVDEKSKTSFVLLSNNMNDPIIDKLMVTIQQKR